MHANSQPSHFRSTIIVHRYCELEDTSAAVGPDPGQYQAANAEHQWTNCLHQTTYITLTRASANSSWTRWKHPPNCNRGTAPASGNDFVSI